PTLTSTLFPYTTLFRSIPPQSSEKYVPKICRISNWRRTSQSGFDESGTTWEGALNLKAESSEHLPPAKRGHAQDPAVQILCHPRSEEHTSELQSLAYLV